MAEFISLYSGSSGNSSVVRCGERYLIVDMGKGVRTTGAALKALDLNISDCAGILVTHEHSDHVKGLSTFLKKNPLPVYGAAATLDFLDANGIRYVERTGTTTDEVMLAAEALVTDGVDAVFTPTDNTIMTAELAIYETFIEAGIPHYTGADSFALNGAFLGYGVDYANLGVETANMVADILLNGADPASTPVMTFDNGTATINTETCAALGMDYDEMAELFAPLCTKVAPITTAESFEDLAQ